MTLNTQFLTIFSMVLSGFYLGIALDTFRRFSHLWKNNVLLVYFLEVCFWLCQTFLLFYVLYRVNTGELRLYVFLSGLLGFSMYQAIAATMYKKILEYIITLTLSIYRFLRRVVQFFIIAPIRWLIFVIITIITFILHLLWKVTCFLVKVLLLPIKWVLRIIYRIIPTKLQKKTNKLAGIYSTIKNTCMKGVNYLIRR